MTEFGGKIADGGPSVVKSNILLLHTVKPTKLSIFVHRGNHCISQDKGSKGTYYGQIVDFGDFGGKNRQQRANLEKKSNISLC